MTRFTPGPGSAIVTPTAEELLHRELVVVREIAHAFLTAERPEEVYQFALERVTSLVGATFSSVYLVHEGSELMELVAAHNWPPRYHPWLGEVRVRLGFGPSGKAAQERTVVEVPDVFADASLEDWQEVASEIGFAALVALPLETRDAVLGAVAFYYRDAAAFTDAQRAVHRLVADQLAAIAEKALLIDQLQRSNAALLTANAELERQYATVVEARRIKDEFLTNITHELRTPLTAVMGYVALLQEGISGPLTPEQDGNLHQVREASERLLGLIDDLLDLTTLKRGGTDLAHEPFDPRDPMRDALARARGRDPAVTLVVEGLDEPVPTMMSDRAKVTKILASLLHNAYKFTARGEVRCTLSIANGRARYRVRDTGLGIPEDAQQLVFDEFRQVDGSTTRRFGGSGLGLALAQRLARLLGGDISVSSVAGEGSTFTLDIPLDHHEAPIASPRDRGVVGSHEAVTLIQSGTT